MEKLVSNLSNKVYNRIQLKSFTLFLVLTFTTLSVFSQKNDIDGGKRYSIGNITVSGAQSFNDITVIAFTGLKKGEEITIPGERIANVIKKLWDENLFSDVNIYVTKIEDDVVDLEINISELPTLNEATIEGVRKGKVKELLKDTKLTKGTKITKNLVTNTKNYITNKYKKSGFLNAQVIVSTKPNVDSTGMEVSQDMRILIDRGPKVKIRSINISGNDQLSDAQVRNAMKKTKRKNPIRLFKRSKYIEEDYKEDLLNIVNKYKERGYRDARIISDSVYDINEKTIAIDIKVEEGRKHYFGDIRFIGNSVYTDQELRAVLGIQKGDVYNGVLLDKKIEDKMDPDADDLVNTYQNNGYLFSRVNPVEVNIKNDTIDFE
ncbi:MAG TPA: POTRA domain-containing protein, partial [Flavobacteriaceae bacterium]|nr:POTRA domain-containing protein [Flavobacteriaceae bacterium]